MIVRAAALFLKVNAVRTKHINSISGGYTMAEEDIYGNKRRYEFLVSRLDDLALPPDERKKTWKHMKYGRYWVKNRENLKYFRRLIDMMEVDDLSYIRRRRNVEWMNIICHSTEKDLNDCDREDIDKIVTHARKTLNPESQAYFIQRIKHFWKRLLPDKDERGRIDDTVFPYVIRHLKPRCDKSRERMRQDKLTWEEYQQIVSYFSKDPRLQAYITLAHESLGRPQEILYRRMRDVELHDNYAKVWVSDHGKEGTGFLQCIDSFPYVAKWYNQHPMKKDPDTFFFVNLGNKNRMKQMNPLSINKELRKACKDLGIEKRITCYSLKRNGVTFRRLRGDTDMQIQHAARWTSTRQLKIYDLSSHDDAFELELKKRGIIPQGKEELKEQIKTCTFCGERHGMTEDICSKCIRPLDRNKLKEQSDTKDAEVLRMRQQLADMETKFDTLLRQLKEGAIEVINRQIES